MQAISSSIAIRPMAAGTEKWANGVVHTDEQTDVYELPTSTPGVAARLELKPIWWGLGREVVATDVRGTRLEAHRGWSGLHRTVVATDPTSGVETVLDPSDRTVTVTTPTVDAPMDGSERRVRHEYHRDARQELAADGSSVYQAGLRGESETYIAGGGRDVMAVVMGETKSWSQIELRPGEAPVAYEMHEDKNRHRQRGETLNASVTADGHLELTQKDGVTLSHELFLNAPSRS